MDKWAVIQFMPILACFIFVFTHFVRVGYKYCIMKRRKALHNNIHLIIGNFLMVFYYMCAMPYFF